MRIAQIVPLQLAVPPRAYGGTERVVYNLVEALVKQGHDVTLYATGDSQTSARLVPMLDTALRFDPDVDATAHHVAMLNEIYADADQYDIIHSHMEYITLPFVDKTHRPTLLTLHGRLDVAAWNRVYRRYPAANYVSISDAQRQFLPRLHWVRTVHHGIDVAEFPFQPRRGDYLTFVGRMSPEKRPDIAIEVAKRTGIPIKIAAKVDHKERPFFEREIVPLLNDPLVEWLGEVDELGKRKLMANALALILPINWPEPFGMVFIEALACGTPVLTCPLGSVPELLVDGVTGYSGCTVEELVEAVGKVRRISREGCRSYAARRFDSSRMASEYVDVYRELRGQRRRSFVAPDPLIAHPAVPDILTRAPKPARRVADSVHGAALS